MDTVENLSYEQVHSAIAQISPASNHRSRKTIWLDSEKTLGVARDQDGRVEIFLFGDEISPNFKVVSENMDYQTWAVSESEAKEANRIRLPKEIHFEAFAAFLCLHLIENGVFRNAPKAFEVSEPTIALAYEKNQTSIHAQVGLIGELLFILNLLVGHPTKSSQIVESWKGHEKSLRDFQFDGLGVEVKTSTTLSSRHHIQGLHQVESGLINGEIPEHSFYILSLGIAATTEDDEPSSFSLVELLDKCIQSMINDDKSLLSRTKKLLIEKSESYLNGFGTKFVYGDPEVEKHFTRRWRSTFVRGYDMSDSNIKILSSAILAESSMVISSSLSFDVNFPNQVTGDLNPITGFHNFIPKISKSLGM